MNEPNFQIKGLATVVEGAMSEVRVRGMVGLEGGRGFYISNQPTTVNPMKAEFVDRSWDGASFKQWVRDAGHDYGRLHDKDIGVRTLDFDERVPAAVLALCLLPNSYDEGRALAEHLSASDYSGKEVVDLRPEKGSGKFGLKHEAVAIDKNMSDLDSDVQRTSPLLMVADMGYNPAVFGAGYLSMTRGGEPFFRTSEIIEPFKQMESKLMEIVRKAEGVFADLRDDRGRSPVPDKSERFQESIQDWDQRMRKAYENAFGIAELPYFLDHVQAAHLWLELGFLKNMDYGKDDVENEFFQDFGRYGTKKYASFKEEIRGIMQETSDTFKRRLRQLEYWKAAPSAEDLVNFEMPGYEHLAELMQGMGANGARIAVIGAVNSAAQDRYGSRLGQLMQDKVRETADKLGSPLAAFGPNDMKLGVRGDYNPLYASVARKG